MTALHPDDVRADAVDELIEFAHETVAEVRKEQDQRDQATTERYVARYANVVQAILEDAGLDIFAPLTSGTYTPTRGWISSPHGLEFEVIPTTRPHPLDERECWALHPQAKIRLCKVHDQTTWLTIAEAIVAYDEDCTDRRFDPEPPPDNPFDDLARVLRDCIRSLDTPENEGLF